ncbi:hypothetical protein BT96DRAFT_947850 [Gymnopus androsaceus JB14]|uniref:Uncharacterized protein n=1 Tax=Gymnopus androsaceus JB14 TaxID=1447944 RepID=A0A6A4GR17_9AGAR|nr:hypothetical protein BT96DRAFT_947850 [Gymnopus androsaceus JB14]
MYSKLTSQFFWAVELDLILGLYIISYPLQSGVPSAILGTISSSIGRLGNLSEREFRRSYDYLLITFSLILHFYYLSIVSHAYLCYGYHLQMSPVLPVGPCTWLSSDSQDDSCSSSLSKPGIVWVFSIVRLAIQPSFIPGDPSLAMKILPQGSPKVLGQNYSAGNGRLLSQYESIAWAFTPGEATDRQILRILRAGYRPDVKEYERHELLMEIHARAHVAIKPYAPQTMPSMSSIELALAHQFAATRLQNSSPFRIGNLHIVGREERNWIISVHGEENLEWMLEPREAQRRLLHDQLAAIKDAILQKMRAQYVQAHPLGINAAVAHGLEKKAFEQGYEALRCQKKRDLEEWNCIRVQKRQRNVVGAMGEEQSANLRECEENEMKNM